MSNTKTKKSTLAQTVLPVLLNEPLTRSQINEVLGVNLTAPYVNHMIKNGLVKPKTTEKTGKRGRPAYVLMLTDKGRKRAKRLVAA